MSSNRALQLAVVLVAAIAVVPFARPTRAADTVSRTRAVTGFERIRLEGSFDAHITAGAGQTHVVVSAASDVVGHITTEVEHGTLVIGMTSEHTLFTQSAKITIAVPILRGFANAGAGSTVISGLTGVDVDIANAGAGSIVASGRAMRENISLDGTGKIDTTGVDAHDVTVNNNGVGVVHVRASGQLTMNVNGVGAIGYTGNPTHVDSQVNGIGHIGRL